MYFFGTLQLELASKNHTHVQIWFFKSNNLFWDFQTKMVKIDTLFRTKTAKKPIPFGAAHTHLAFIVGYPCPCRYPFRSRN